MLCDGVSCTLLALQEANVYGYIKVEKEDCVNHVEKRMGTGLHNLISKHKGTAGESLGSQGKLTADLVAKLSCHYGWALRPHKGDIEATLKAVLVVYYHITSDNTASNHNLCS